MKRRIRVFNNKLSSVQRFSVYLNPIQRNFNFCCYYFYSQTKTECFEIHSQNCFNNNSIGQLTMFQIQFYRGIMRGGVKTSIINLEVLYCVLPAFCSPEQISILHYSMRKCRSQLIVCCTNRFTRY